MSLEQQLQPWLQKYFIPLLLAGLIINFSAINLTIIEPDGALYASIAKKMALHKDFINLYAVGNDWLDKPHFPFWVTAISFLIFGVNTIAYKLPALLFWLTGLFYTYKFAKTFYSGTVAKTAVLIFVTAQHLIISNNDVRAEPYLTGLIIAATYHFYKAINKPLGIHIIAGSLFTACAIMTKGLFVGVPIFGGIFLHLLIKKQLVLLLQWKWLLAAVLTSIFILPELYTLYVQFDLHPEKVVFGKTGVSGIKFFFWDSQFGRFANTGPIKGKGDYSFFIHTLLWAFLPWPLLMYTGLFTQIKALIKKIALPEYISLGSALFTIILFSLSKFQLPHYTNIIFSFLAVITAVFINQLTIQKQLNIFFVVQAAIATVIFIATIGIALLYRPQYLWLCIILILLLIALSVFLFGKKRPYNILGISIAASIVANVFMNCFFYPSLVKYQAGSQAARHFNNMHLKQQVAMYIPHSYSFDFYLNQQVEYFNLDLIKNITVKQPLIVYADKNNVADIKEAGLQTEEIHSFPYYPITRLKPKFVYYKTRAQQTKQIVLLKVWK
jgi:4-amino-4-deoxy-L-arabinose transferase-like glycosyltransferase